MEPSETKFEPHVLLAEHGISQAEFDTTQLEWDLLREIAQDHTTSLPSLQSAANYISQRLQTVNGIHSLKVISIYKQSGVSFHNCTHTFAVAVCSSAADQSRLRSAPTIYDPSLASWQPI